MNGTRDFHEQLKTILPRLRIYALSLTRDRDAADDLVHDTVIKALTGRQQLPARHQPRRLACSASSAMNSSPVSVVAGRRFPSTRRSPSRFLTRLIRIVVWSCVSS